MIYFKLQVQNFLNLNPAKTVKDCVLIQFQNSKEELESFLGSSGRLENQNSS